MHTICLLQATIMTPSFRKSLMFDAYSYHLLWSMSYPIAQELTMNRTFFTFLLVIRNDLRLKKQAADACSLSIPCSSTTSYACSYTASLICNIYIRKGFCRVHIRKSGNVNPERFFKNCGGTIFNFPIQLALILATNISCSQQLGYYAGHPLLRIA